MDLTEALERIDADPRPPRPRRTVPRLPPRRAGPLRRRRPGRRTAQPLLVADSPASFVAYWVGIALVCAAVGGGVTVHAHLFREDDLARQRHPRRRWVSSSPAWRRGHLTAAMIREPWRPLAVPLLPGLWAMLFGLGIVASLPYLPRLTGLVAGWYF